jgi:hypothetical protein
MYSPLGGDNEMTVTALVNCLSQSYDHFGIHRNSLHCMWLEDSVFYEFTLQSDCSMSLRKV